MNIQLLVENFTNPSLLLFFLGLLAVQMKSDLEIPPTSSKFIAVYLLFAIGFKGGQELSHSPFTVEIAWTLFFGMAMAVVVPMYTFFILRTKFSVPNAGAIAAAYGSVSAVTFVTAISFLEQQEVAFGGHMVATMALMEAPSIVIAVVLMRYFSKDQSKSVSYGTAIKHALTNGSVVLILGSLLVGFLASETQAEGIKPFTTDIFKGFLAIFLLDMGITSGKKLKVLFKQGKFPFVFSIVIPLVNGIIVALVSQFFIEADGNRLLLSILAASASYIAVPAAMQLAAPKANPGLYVPMALAITFPFNISIGLPLFWSIILW